MVSNSEMLHVTTTGFYLLLFIGYSNSLSNTRCFVEYDGRSLCFTQPDPLVTLSWSNAMAWCKGIGGTLPTLEWQNTLYGNVLGYFGLHTETLWLGANFTYDPDNWFWTNGSSFTGTLEDRNTLGKTHAYITRNGTEVKLVAAVHTDTKFFVCQYPYSDLSCSSYYEDSYWTSEKCYVKTKGGVSWDSYQSYCGPQNLAIIDNVNDFSRWLEDLTHFWIGLRCSWWTWHNAVTGDSYEVMENRFDNANDLLNDTRPQCLASYRTVNGDVRWTNQDCDTNLPFICQYNVDASATTSATLTITPNDPTFVTEFTSSTTLINPTTSTSHPATPTTPPSAQTFTPTTVALAVTSTHTNKQTSTSVSRTTTHVPDFQTTPTNSPTTTASGGETVFSGSQTAATTSLRDNSEYKSAVFGISMEFFVGLGGGLLLTVAVWLALITAFVCKLPRGAKIYPE